MHIHIQTDQIAGVLLRALSKWPVLRIGEAGTFIRKEQPARWDPDQQLIFPPTIVLDFVKGFGTQLSFEDYLIESEGLSPESARSVAQQLQTKIVSGLATTSSFTIPGLGKISQTANGELSFFTEESALPFLDEQSFGLRQVSARRESARPGPVANKAIHMKALSKEKSPARDRLFGWKFFLVVALLGSLGALLVQYGPWDFQLSPDKNSNTVTSQQEMIPASQQPVQTDSPESGSNMASGSEQPEMTDPAIPTENAASNVIDTGSSTMLPAEASSSESANRRGAPIASAEPLTRGAPESSTDVIASSPVGDMGVFRGGDGAENARVLAPIRDYHLIAASFNKAAGAQEYVVQLKAEGFDAMILYPEEGSDEPHRVSIYRNEDRQKVAAFAEKLKQMGRQGGWVYAERSQTGQ